MSAIARYAAKKILIGIPVILSLTLLIFFLMRLVPGDPIHTIIPSQRELPKDKIEELKIAWGLDEPIYVQYFYWLSHLMRGDLGTCFLTKQPVSFLILTRLPFTLKLTFSSLFLAYIIGIPVGIIAALKRGTLFESFVMGFTVFVYSMPSYWLALILMLVFGLYLGIFPISGISGPYSMILPTVTLAFPSVAYIAKLTRTEMVEVLTEDFVRTAWAKGLPSRIVILKHALRNALIPVTVMFFLDVPWVISGAIIVETVFAWPGMGALFTRGIFRQDYPVVQAIILVIGILTVICNILGDIASAYLDPRIRLEKERL